MAVFCVEQVEVKDRLGVMFEEAVPCDDEGVASWHGGQRLSRIEKFVFYPAHHTFELHAGANANVRARPHWKPAVVFGLMNAIEDFCRMLTLRL